MHDANSVCITRTTTASLMFDIAVATITAWLDEARQLKRTDDGDNNVATVPSQPTWFFYNFRMATQIVVLLYNLARLIYEAYDNQGFIAVLNAVRCVCLVGLITRHYFVCNYRWDMLMTGEKGHLVLLQMFFMWTYSIIGTVASSIDPYFASDTVLMSVFFMVPLGLRLVAIMISKAYAKLFTRVVGGLLVEAYVSPLLVQTSLVATFYFALCVAKPVSLFFADWLLTGVALLLPSIVGAFGAWRRKRVNDDIRQKHTTGYPENENNNNNNNIVVPVNGDDETGRLDDFNFPEDTRGTGSDKTGRETKVDPSPEQSPTLPPRVASHDNVGCSSLTNDGQCEDAGDRRSLTMMTSKGEQLIVDIERGKAFTEAKIFVLLSAVSCTFMVMQAAELAMSMGILYATGAPANWCRPFSFADVNKGFQVVLDFLI